jgi:hypothetical protein
VFESLDSVSGLSFLYGVLLVRIQFSVMEDHQRDLHLLIPNIPVHRPLIRACPFSTELQLDRGNKDWLKVMDARFFIYPVCVLLMPGLSA